MRDILVSLDPERAERIFAGLQTYEIRKTLPRLPARVCFFDPARKALTGEAEIFEAIALAPRPGEPVFKGLLAEACVTEAQLRRTAGDGAIFGWHLEHVRKYPEPRPYKGSVPLPWQYLPLSKI